MDHVTDARNEADEKFTLELTSLVISELDKISWLGPPLDLSHYNAQLPLDPALVDHCIKSGEIVFITATIWNIRRHIVGISGFESNLISKAIIQDNVFAALTKCTATVPLSPLSATQALKLQFYLLVNGEGGHANAALNWVWENLVDVLRPLVRHCQKLETERKAKNIPRPTAFTELASFWRAQDNDTPAQAPQGGL
ncbi:hypothetical protein C8R47DRAFT_1125431 [Mycena vitilis]|nr:hypothetical protein C8R47DRAFT_1125431 [Mycena vitilis]